MAEMIRSFEGKFRFLSNFWPSEVNLDGTTFPTVEHAYQAAKTLNPKTRELFLHICTAGGAKSFGKDLKLREDWAEVKETIMLDLLRQKFQIPRLQREMLNTGNAEIVEGNYWHDTYWGVCNGEGQNRLGKLLMQVRDEIRNNTFAF